MRRLLCCFLTLTLVGCGAAPHSFSSLAGGGSWCDWRWDAAGNKVCIDDQEKRESSSLAEDRAGGTSCSGSNASGSASCDEPRQASAISQDPSNANSSNVAPCQRWGWDAYGNRICDSYGTTEYGTRQGRYETTANGAGSGSGTSGGDSGPHLSDAVQLLTGAAGIASGLASMRSVGSIGSTYRGGSSGSIPATDGYSQVGAFKDCNVMYQAAGMTDLAAKCASRATDMSSMPGMRILR